MTGSGEAAMTGTTVRRTSWLAAVGIHVGRVLRHRFGSPSALGMTLGMPVAMLVITVVAFDGMVEQFTGRSLDIASVAVMVAFSSAFTAALMGAGDTVHERHQGLPDRLATLPGAASSGYVGRVLAESVRAGAAVVAALVTGLVGGADYGSVAHLGWVLAVLSVVALAAGSVGVMLGYVVETSQGAVSFSPLIMVAMFFNTAMMPRQMYAESLRPVVDASPVTAVTTVVTGIRADAVGAGDLGVFAAWFVGLTGLSVVVLALRARSRR